MREQWREVIERNAVAHFGRVTSVYFFHLNQRKILFTLAWRPDAALYGIACFQSEKFYLRLGNINIIGAGQIIVIGRREKSITLGNSFQKTFTNYASIKIINYFFLRVPDKGL